MKANWTYGVLALAAAVFAAACDKPQSREAHEDVSSDKDRAPPAVTQTAALEALDGAHRLEGVATILNADTLLQIDADMRATGIAANFSRATADRYKSTSSLSRQIIENAERQAGTDGTQQKLLESRLKQTWGDGAPFLESGKRQTLIASLSSGSEALVRLDFPELTAGTPRNVNVAPLAGGSPTPVKALWPAPSGNLSMPGVSYFGLIDQRPGLRPGDRARLLADGATPTSGIVIPDAAIVVFAAQSWCYIETQPQTFERRAVPLDHPVEGGYLVKTGFAAGQRVVVRGASLLLSREAGPGDDEDDDDGAHKAKPVTGPPVVEKPDVKPGADTDTVPAKKASKAPGAVAEKRTGGKAADVDRD